MVGMGQIDEDAAATVTGGSGLNTARHFRKNSARASPQSSFAHVDQTFNSRAQHSKESLEQTREVNPWLDPYLASPTVQSVNLVGATQPHTDRKQQRAAGAGMQVMRIVATPTTAAKLQARRQKELLLQQELMRRLTAQMVEQQSRCIKANDRIVNQTPSRKCE